MTDTTDVVADIVAASVRNAVGVTVDWETYRRIGPETLPEGAL